MSEVAQKHEQTAMSLAAQSPVTNTSVVVNDSGSLMGAIITAGSTPGVNVENIERMMAMYERLEAKKAEQAFNAAMTDAQTEMRPVAADANNPQTKSKYATYHALDKALRPIYTKHGFSPSFDTDDSPKPDHIRVLCYLSHRGGYTRTYKIDMPCDGKGAKGGDVMTKTHAAGSALSYGQRYLLKGMFNISISDDDDGNAAEGAPCIDESQAIQLTDLAAKAFPDPKGTAHLIARICKKFEIENTTQMKASDFPEACRLLNDTIASVRDKERAAAAEKKVQA